MNANGRRPSRLLTLLLFIAAASQCGCFSWRHAPATTAAAPVANSVPDADKTIDLTTEANIHGMFGNYQSAERNLREYFKIELERLGYLVNEVPNGKAKGDHARMFVALELATGGASDFSLGLCTFTFAIIPGYASHAFTITGDAIIADKRERILSDSSEINQFVWLPLFWGVFLCDQTPELMDQTIRDAAHRFVTAARSRQLLVTGPDRR